MNKPCVAFFLNGKEISRYTIRGTFAGEMEETVNLLAYDHGVTPDQISVRQDGCWNCNEYNGDCCMKCWNNADPDYYIPDRDDKKPDDLCPDWNEDKQAVWEDFFEGGV